MLIYTSARDLKECNNLNISKPWTIKQYAHVNSKKNQQYKNAAE